MNKFTEAELVGREIWNEKLLRNGSSAITFTTNTYDSVDVMWEKYDTTYVGEIKYREKYSSSAKCIAEQGVMLEKTKYDALKYYQSASGFCPYYIHIFNDGKIYLYDLNDLEPEWVEEENKFPRTTKGDKTKVKKVVTYLPLSGGTQCCYSK